MDLFADSGQETNSTSTAEQVKIANAKIFLLTSAKKNSKRKIQLEFLSSGFQQ
jgi:hypothetical protein